MLTLLDQVTVYDALGLQIQRMLPAHNGVLANMAFNMDGELHLSASEPNSCAPLVLDRVTSQNLLSIRAFLLRDSIVLRCVRHCAHCCGVVSHYAHCCGVSVTMLTGAVWSVTVFSAAVWSGTMLSAAVWSVTVFSAAVVWHCAHWCGVVRYCARHVFEARDFDSSVPDA